MPASVTVEGGGSGSDLDSFSDASQDPPAIAVYNADVLGVYLVLIIPHMMAHCSDMLNTCASELLYSIFGEIVAYQLRRRIFLHIVYFASYAYYLVFYN